MRDFTLTSLQAFLEGKAASGLSFSVVDHLRWDLSVIFEMGIAEKVIESSPATSLYTPKHAPKGMLACRVAHGARTCQVATVSRLRGRTCRSRISKLGLSLTRARAYYCRSSMPAENK